MLPGDVCRCIADFESGLPGELLLYKNDIIQVHKIIDKLWLEGEAAGMVGRFPCGIVVKLDLPPYPEHLPLFVAAADFNPAEEGDLPLRRGDFIIGLNEIDDSWWHGESHGNKGVFPKNFVWKINREIMSHNDTDSSRLVRMKGKVLRNMKAQLPEEMDLYIGDIVTVTSSIDNDWFRGECDNREGIFPKNFIEIISDNEEIPDAAIIDTNNLLQNLNLASCRSAPYTSHLSRGVAQDLSSELVRTIKEDDDDALFEDDYFRQNMPNMYRPSTGRHWSNSASFCTSESDLNIFEDNTTFNSISAKVDNYFGNSSDQHSETLKDLLDIDFTGSYTEDNTGIHPYGRAVFSFSAQYKNELSFKKGDVIHLIKHIDSHWTEGKLGDSKGIFPTSYIDIIVNCLHRSEEVFEKRSATSPRLPLGHALVCHAFNGDKPGEIKVEQGDIIATVKYISDEWVEVRKDSGEGGLVPVSHLKMAAGGHPDSSSPCEMHYDAEHILSKNSPPRSVNWGDRRPLQFGKEEEINLIDLDIANDTSEVLKFQLGKIERLPPLPPRPKVNKVKSTSLEYPPHEGRFLGAAKSLPTPEGGMVSTVSFMSEGARSFPEDKCPIGADDKVEEEDSSSLEFGPKRPAPPLPPLSRQESEEEEQTPKDSGAAKSAISEDTNEEVYEKRDSGSSDDSKLLKMIKLRRESVKELVTTEYEYIHDLEALMQVVRLSRKQKEVASVDLKVLLGNIIDVIKLAKKFVKLLDSVSFENDETMLIGPIFISVAEEMCHVYKVYSSNNSLSVGPLLKKYQEGGEPAVFLKWVLHELRQHKINLLDLQAVLIKPVQRVLKYPLFIDQLLHHTPNFHDDFRHLEEARKEMLNVAKEINDYTKRLDLVTKYRAGAGYSFGEIMQRMSMRSVAKKSSRFKTRLSATIGLMNQTRDLEFEEEEAKFHSVVKAAQAICNQGKKLMENLRVKHRAELAIIEAIAVAMRGEPQSQTVESVRNACRETCLRLLPMFESLVLHRVVEPTEALLKMCVAPERLIIKRFDKLIDYDASQHKLDKNKDATRTRILEEELSGAKGVYEALNKQLLLDLPVLNSNAISLLTLATKSLVAARMKFEGHITKLYLDLAQVSEFSLDGNSDYLAKFKQEHQAQTEALKTLSFLPSDFVLKSPKFGKRKTSFMGIGRDSKRKISVEKPPHGVPSMKVNVLETYDSANVYTVTSDHKANDQFELDLKAGTVVGVIKKKDPLGKEDRWFVDNGEKKGFVKAAFLKQGRIDHSTHPVVLGTSALGSDSVGHDASVAGMSQTQVNDAVDGSVDSDSTSTIPHNPSADGTSGIPVKELPPRYEDLFPHQEDREVPHPPISEEDNVYSEIVEVERPDEERLQAEGGLEDPIYEVIPEEDLGCTKTAGGRIQDAESQFYYALYHFGSLDANQLTLQEGQVVLLLLASGGDWWFVEDRNGNRGYVPSSYLRKYR